MIMMMFLIEVVMIADCDDVDDNVVDDNDDDDSDDDDNVDCDDIDKVTNDNSCYGYHCF